MIFRMEKKTDRFEYVSEGKKSHSSAKKMHLTLFVYGSLNVQALYHRCTKTTSTSTHTHATVMWQGNFTHKYPISYIYLQQQSV